MLPNSSLTFSPLCTEYSKMTLFETHKWVRTPSPNYRYAMELTRSTFAEELRSTGQELQTLVQEKVGTTLFAAEYSRIRQGVLNVRRDRRTAKAVQVCDFLAYKSCLRVFPSLRCLASQGHNCSGARCKTKNPA